MEQSLNLKLRCECGEVRGRLLVKSLEEGNNITCMCDDCQSFAHYLEKGQTILNENGGTPIFQVTPNKVEITKGKDKLTCMQLGPKGIKRWYTSCCKTPVANTLSAKMAFNGIFHQMIDFNSMAPEVAQSMSRFRNHCMGHFGKGELPANTSKKFPLGLTLKIMGTLLKGKVLKTYQPNAFFDIETGRPIQNPIIITKEERTKLKMQGR